MSTVAARFYVSEIRKVAGGGAGIVTLKAVSSDENRTWSEYTPSGEITMSLTRKASAAAKVFEDNLGKEFSVLFELDDRTQEQKIQWGKDESERQRKEREAAGGA